MTGLSIGVLLPTRHLGIGENSARTVIRAARAAEDCGFDSVWVGDSLVARPRLDPLTALAGVAASTRRVAIGTAVLLAAMRPPLPTAHALAGVDLLSDGRLIVGVGAGASVPATEEDFRAAGAGYEGRVRRLYDTVDLWRAVWSGFKAPHLRSFPDLAGLTLEPRPAQAGGPQLWLAGEGPHTLRHAGAEFDGWLPFSATAEGFGGAAASVRTAADTAGRPQPTMAAYLTVTIDDDPVQALMEQTNFAEAYYGVPYDFMKAVQGYCAGTADEVAARLRSYVAAGVEHIVLRLAGNLFFEQLERAATVADSLTSA